MDFPLPTPFHSRHQKRAIIKGSFMGTIILNRNNINT